MPLLCGFAHNSLSPFRSVIEQIIVEYLAAFSFVCEQVFYNSSNMNKMTHILLLCHKA